MSEVIFADRERNLVLRRSSTYTPAFVAFLEGTVWGSGGVQYTMPGLGAILNRIAEPHFLSLTADGELVAVSTLSKKTTRLGGTTYPAFYSYALAVAPAKRGRGYGALLAEQALRYGLSHLGDKGIYYGYVEAGNTRSLRTLHQVGRQALGQYHILLVSRLRPHDEARLERLEGARRDHLVHLLSEIYDEHALLDVDQSVTCQDYYITREGDDIMAGVQAEPRRLFMRHLPGAGGLLLIKVLPYIPVLRRLFPHRHYQFLTFGNLYARPGQEAALFTLMEALLARHRLHFGMISMDKRSPMYQRLAAVGKFGFLNALMDVPVQVMATFKGFTAAEIADLRRQPLFISSMDPV